LVASRSRATFSEDPSAVVASNEASSATLHLTERGASADDAAWIATVAVAGGSADCSNKGDEGDEERLHVEEFGVARRWGVCVLNWAFVGGAAIV